MFMNSHLKWLNGRTKLYKISGERQLSARANKGAGERVRERDSGGERGRERVFMIVCCNEKMV